MPAYDYICNNCKKEFTLFLSIKDYEASPRVTCPNCKSPDVQRKFSEFFAKTASKA